MKLLKQRVPDNFEEFVSFSSVALSMPGESAFRFTVKIKDDSEEVVWERVWYLPDINFIFSMADLAWDQEKVVAVTKAHEMHRFKEDIVHHLRRTNQCLSIDNRQLVIQPD